MGCGSIPGRPREGVGVVVIQLVGVEEEGEGTGTVDDIINILRPTTMVAAGEGEEMEGRVRLLDTMGTRLPPHPPPP